jgi:KDO2-lipid IV(A) lauroyltransferase
VSGYGGYLAYRFGAAVFGAMPEPVMRRTGEALGALWYLLDRKRRDLVRRNLARVVGETGATPARTRAMFSAYGRYWAETFWVRPRRKAAILAHSTVDRPDRLRDAQAAGKGVILALPHLGNWELAGPTAEALGLPVLAAAEALPNQRIVDWFVDIRRQLGIEVVVVGKDRRATGELLERLREGGTVGLVADRDLSGRGVPIEFFGEMTTLPAGPVALADRTGAVILPVGCYFRAGRGHDFAVGKPIVVPDLPDRDDRIAAGTRLVADAFEGIIRRHPEQWHMFSVNWPSDRRPS